MSILDSSAIIAFLRNEAGHERIKDALIAGAAVSAANLAEVATVLVRDNASEEEARSILEDLPVSVLDVTNDIAIEAGLMFARTRRFGLSLGDRICLATSLREARAVLTADRVWSQVGPLVGVTVEVIR